MTATNVTYQSPQPEIVIFAPDNANEAKTILTPYPKGYANRSYLTTADALQSYQFSLTNGDSKGSFSMTLFPDVVTAQGRVPLWDKIKVRDVVKIYENKAEAAGTGKPVFVGMVMRKKFVMQAGDGGASRRLSISGTAITALVSQFRLELDTRAIVLKIADKLHSGSKEEVATAQSTGGDADVIAKINAFKIDADEAADKVIQNAWNCYKSISEQFGTIAIGKEIDTFMPTGAFDCVNAPPFKYPMCGATLINSSSAQDFDSLIDKLFPAPVYEKTAYTDKNGNMKIRLRQVPFDASTWANVSQVIPHPIAPQYVKSIDLEQSDKEVYTVFFSYLIGSPTTEDFNYILAATGAKGSSMPSYLEDKFAIYGYRPLNCSLYGYTFADEAKGETGKDKETKEDDAEKIKKAAEERQAQITADNTTLRTLNENLARWYGRLDEMLQGSLSLAMTYDDNSRIMPGDKVALLGCEFYVEGIAHSWSYGGGGDINISLSRGGQYTDGNFDGVPAKFTDAMQMFRDGQSIANVTTKMLQTTEKTITV